MTVYLLMLCEEFEQSISHGVYASAEAAKAAVEKLGYVDAGTWTDLGDILELPLLDRTSFWRIEPEEVQT